MNGRNGNKAGRKTFCNFFFIKPWQTHKRTISILSERGWGGGGRGVSPFPRESAGKIRNSGVLAINTWVEILCINIKL